MDIVRKILNGISAGIMICIGCSVFLACDSKYAGAVLFSVALLTICYKGYSLYTGKIGFIPEKHGAEEIAVLLWGLLGNIIATGLLGTAIRFALPNLNETAVKMCEAKLTQLPLATFLRACLCGVLMYVAVSIFKDGKQTLGIIFGIPVFILSGFEHSIADMGYFAVAGKFDLKVAVFIIIVLLGNSVGAMALPLLSPDKKQ